jgi:gamma-glutamylcyclotransferase (GGCT)/AIG2-like uncharacterized protein YtfP
MTRIFVYGTLRSDGRAHELMGESQFRASIRTSPSYQLYDFGAFPGMIKGEPSGDGVYGEVYDCDEAVMKRLDRYECIADGLFERVEIELSDGSKAEAYLFAQSKGSPDSRIEGGKWENE